MIHPDKCEDREDGSTCNNKNKQLHPPSLCPPPRCRHSRRNWSSFSLRELLWRRTASQKTASIQLTPCQAGVSLTWDGSDCVSSRKSSDNRKELTGIDAASQASEEEKQKKRSFAAGGVRRSRSKEERQGWQRTGAVEIAEVCPRPQPRNCLNTFGAAASAGRREGREKERNISVREKHQLVASRAPPKGNLACNPGMCPDRELNQ
ncbi:uncharacterized protein LOC129077789 [Pteronotus mesoamericanus]|uniref:uncharacterized protein LOC129077789 n=1 Tax=Pteronotus mesoamericanus TaxID=1884717 RepID=UPI0023ED7028|nr:uncharacterized protein LOC129077789 [Pteronotus parnellii mesoamericanus]